MSPCAVGRAFLVVLMKSQLKNLLFASALLGLALPSYASTSSFDHGELSSSVEYSDQSSNFTYQYIVAAQPEGHDLSHVVIGFGRDCEDHLISADATVPHAIELRLESLKFDDLRVSSSDPVTFTITSPHPPGEGTLIAKAARDRFAAAVLVPDCSFSHSVPEPEKVLLVSLGCLPLLLRRRR